MKLETKTLPELTELKVRLLKQIARSPDHSGIQRAELRNVQPGLNYELGKPKGAR